MTLRNFDIAKKIAGPYHLKITEVLWQNLILSGTKGAPKSAFPDFHGNTLEIKDCNFAMTISDPDRLSVPSLVKIGVTDGIPGPKR